MDVPLTLECVECGGVAHRLPLDEGEFEPGDVVPFVCEDCNHRHDIVLEEDTAPD
jgi:hypothetical protein